MDGDRESVGRQAGLRETMNKIERHASPLARNVRRLGHLDLAGRGPGHDLRLACLCRAHSEPGPSRHLDHRRLRSAQPARGRHRHARRSGVAQPQGAGRRRHHDRQSRAEHEPDRPARRAAAGGAARVDRGARTRADAAGNRRQDERHRRRPARARGIRAARLSQRRLQDLRRLRSGAAEADLLPEDRRHRRASLRHGRAPCLHLDRDAGLCRQHPRGLRSARSATAAGGVALVDARAARRRRRDADLVGPAAPAASRAALRQRDVGELLARRLLGGRRVRPRRSRRAPAATTITRCFRSRRIP